VVSPGVVQMPPGSRVAEAVEAAGGAGPDADLTRLNLARPLLDGEQVVVPRPGEPLPDVAAPPPVGAAGAGAALPAGSPLDLNAATLAQLDTLPGIGPVLAQRILDFRAEQGRFTSVAELGEVSGIGDAVLADLEPHVRV
jgi:competence protein ComEA